MTALTASRGGAGGWGGGGWLCSSREKLKEEVNGGRPQNPKEERTAEWPRPGLEGVGNGAGLAKEHICLWERHTEAMRVGHLRLHPQLRTVLPLPACRFCLPPSLARPSQDWLTLGFPSAGLSLPLG